MIAVVAMMASCSKNDEPDPPTYDGVSIYLNAVIAFYDNANQPSYTPSGTEGVYVGWTSSSEEAHDFICKILESTSWDGKDLTLPLGENGEEGNLTIIGSTPTLLSQGIYNKIIIDIKGYTPYTLEIITEQQADNGYGEGQVVKKIDSNL